MSKDSNVVNGKYGLLTAARARASSMQSWSLSRLHHWMSKVFGLNKNNFEVILFVFVFVVFFFFFLHGFLRGFFFLFVHSISLGSSEAN